MTPDEIQELIEAATPGPWTADDEHGLMPGATPAWCVSSMTTEGRYLDDIAYMAYQHDQAIADAALIIALRNDAARLVAALRWAEALIESWDRINSAPHESHNIGAARAAETAYRKLTQ